MLLPLLGSENCERVLVFILARDEGYATQIAQFFKTNIYGIQTQLDKLEHGAVLVSFSRGRTRIYTFNPRYPFLKEVKNLLERVVAFYPQGVQEALMMNRRRPRRREKPL